MPEKLKPSENFQFKEDLRVAINRNSIDSQTGISDFILADIIANLVSQESLLAYLTRSMIKDNWPKPHKTGE